MPFLALNVANGAKFLKSLFCKSTFVCFILLGVKDPHLYTCPIYKKPIRTDMNYIAAVDLKTTLSPEYWILRGVALLCDVK